jgi:DNA-directed RNA polymerase specialized sigma24 family protein
MDMTLEPPLSDASGDEQEEALHDAFAMLRLLAPRVRRVALRHLREPAEADALLRQVMAITIDQLQSGALREAAELPGFVLAACRLALQDRRRGELRGPDDALLRRHAALLAEAGRAPPPPAPPAPACVAERLQRMSGRERAVVLMSCWDGSPAAALGAQLGCSERDVLALRRRGFERLGCSGGRRRTAAE